MSVTHEGVQRHYGIGTTSYLPAVRAAPDISVAAASDVQRWRRMGASWQAIANNLGVSVDAARKRFDPTYVPVHAPAQPIVAPKAPGGPPVGCVFRNTYQFDILVALEAGNLASGELASRVATRRADFYRLISALKDKRLIAEPRGGQIALTDAGRAELQWHHDHAGGKAAAAEQSRRSAAKLSGKRARALRVLAALAKEPLTSLELSERERLSYDQARDVLAALRADGEVELQRGCRDRAFLWGLTAQGRASVEAAAL